MRPVPSKLSYTAIQEYAEKIGSHYGAYDQAGKADVKSLLTKLGGVYHPKGDVNVLTVSEPQNFALSLALFTSERRQTFQTAQNIGFYVLHYLHQNITERLVFNYSELDDAVIVQANVFASALLMPTNLFLQSIILNQDDRNWEWVVADQFNVSPKAVMVRAQTLRS